MESTLPSRSQQILVDYTIITRSIIVLSYKVTITLSLSYIHYLFVGVADSECRFITIDVGAFGRQSDGGTLRQTPIYTQLCDGSFPMPHDCTLPNSSQVVPHYLVGDEAYPLRTFLMRPFPGSVLNDQRREFNRRISRARQCIECCFGILAAKFRVLKSDIELCANKVDLIVKACCILHNCIIDQEGKLFIQMNCLYYY